MSFDRKALAAKIRGKTEKQALPIIADAMTVAETDSDRQYLSDLIDKILQTGMPAEDQEAVGAWEASRRRGS